MNKLLPSSSCSSSSSFSSSTFNANLCNPKAATPSCLAGILRRILCSGSLPTHPSDQINEEASSVKSDDIILQSQGLSSIEAKPSAGIVARLMGLDSMPKVNENLNLVSRSRSMNSVEHFHKHMEGNQGVESTLSFREIPTFLELENDDFLILSFEEESRSEELRTKQRRIKQEFTGETKQLYERRRKKKKMKKKHRSIDSEETKEYVQIDFTRTSDKQTSKVDFNGHENLQVGSVAGRIIASDESSPVSVLDCSQFLRDPEPSLSEHDSNSSILPRRKLSPELESFQNPSRNDGNLMIDDREVPTMKWEEEIWRIIETDLRESNWNYSRICQKDEECEGIFAGFGSYIVDRLMDEFVEQMYDLPLMNKLNL